MDAQEVISAYCGAMETIKLRVDLALALTTNRYKLPDFAAAELAQLQIRKICETLALGCLIVHGDIEGAKSARLSSAYQADFIMNALQKLHPHFYPEPTRQIRDAKGIPVDWVRIKDGYLTKDELLKTYREAADFLHVGDMSGMLSKKQKTVRMANVREWIVRLIALLEHHNIFLADEPLSPSEPAKPPLVFSDGSPAPRRYLVVGMEMGDAGRPSATLFRALEPDSKGEVKWRPKDSP